MCAVAACAGRHTTSQTAAIPAFLLGSFTDDYGARYRISPTDWVQLPRARYHIIRWDIANQFAIARNDSTNPGDGGRYTRIDWLRLEGFPEYPWAFCYSAYQAPTAAVAETVTVANRTTPRTGCNGFPFSRMRRTPSDSNMVGGSK